MLLKRMVGLIQNCLVSKSMGKKGVPCRRLDDSSMEILQNNVEQRSCKIKKRKLSKRKTECKMEQIIQPKMEKKKMDL